MENNAKGALLRATIEIVAQEGMYDFSMKRVTQRAGVSEALVYKHFGTKDNLLFCCYLDIHRQIGALFNNLSLLTIHNNRDEMLVAIRLYWMIYFDYLIKHGNEAIFYFAYRDSSYMERIRAQQSEDAAASFKDFADFFNLVDAQLQVSQKVSSYHLWCYILDTTGMFARRVIRGELPNTPQSIESIWQLIFCGIAGLLGR